MEGDEALVITSLVLIMAIFLRRRSRRMRLMALQTRRMQRNAVMLSIQQQNNINHRKRKTTCAGGIVNPSKRGAGLKSSAILNHEAN